MNEVFQYLLVKLFEFDFISSYELIYSISILVLHLCINQCSHRHMLDRKLLDEFIIAGLYEDVREGDHTSQACIPQNDRSGKIIGKS